MFQMLKKKKHTGLVSPVDGLTIPMEEVKDPAFADKTLGDGIAAVPENGMVVSPCDGTLVTVTPTLHAFAIACEDGLELMVHIGIDTVALKGQGFESLANAGDVVKKGQPIIKFDSVFMKENNIDMTTMLILLNGDEYQIKEKHHGKQVRKGIDTVIEYCR